MANRGMIVRNFGHPQIVSYKYCHNPALQDGHCTGLYTGNNNNRLASGFINLHRALFQLRPRPCLHLPPPIVPAPHSPFVNRHLQLSPPAPSSPPSSLPLPPPRFPHNYTILAAFQVPFCGQQPADARRVARDLVCCNSNPKYTPFRHCACIPQGVAAQLKSRVSRICSLSAGVRSLYLTALLDKVAARCTGTRTISFSSSWLSRKAGLSVPTTNRALREFPALGTRPSYAQLKQRAGKR